MIENLYDLPSVLNLIECKSPVKTPDAVCYQGITDKMRFIDFISDATFTGTFRAMNVTECDRYNRLLKAYYYDHCLIHARINMESGIVNLICYSLFTDKITLLEAESLIFTIRQHLDQF